MSKVEYFRKSDNKHFRIGYYVVLNGKNEETATLDKMTFDDIKKYSMKSLVITNIDNDNDIEVNHSRWVDPSWIDLIGDHMHFARDHFEMDEGYGDDDFIEEVNDKNLAFTEMLDFERLLTEYDITYKVTNPFSWCVR